ncbi:MAG: transcriptional regulator NrdR [Spirochaetota bacterium]
MRCPHCGSMEDRVLESRQNSSGSTIRRRRECLHCGYRYTSYERIEEKPVMVIKRDGRREAFDLDKLERGLQTSLEKRSISQERVEQMLHEIEDAAVLKAGSRREITSHSIGEMVLERLYRVDPIAYVRFASVYRMFNNVSEFIHEIEKLTSSTS